MKYCEFYGALLSRLNRNISYINISVLNEELGFDKSDTERLVEDVCRKGLARKINDTEYELICDISQLRDFVLELENASISATIKGDYSEDGSKPISLGEIAEGDWNIKEVEKKEEESPFERLRRRRREGRERLHSLFDDDDDDDDEGSHERASEEFKGYIMQMRTYNPEDETFEPELRAYFPGGKEYIILGYGIDEDKDLFLTDKCSLYNYLLGKMPFKEDECSKDLASQFIAKLVRSSSFMRTNNEITNFVTGSTGMEYLRKEIDYYYTQYGTFLSSIPWFVKLEPVSDEEYKTALNQKTEEFLKQCAAGEVDLSAPRGLSVSASKTIIYKIISLDPRISKDEAIEIAIRLKACASSTPSLSESVTFVDAAINMLQAYSISTYNSVKIDYFSRND